MMTGYEGVGEERIIIQQESHWSKEKIVDVDTTGIQGLARELFHRVEEKGFVYA